MHALLLGLLLAISGEAPHRCQLNVSPARPVTGQDAVLTLSMPDHQWVVNDANPDGAPQPIAIRFDDEEGHAAAGTKPGEYVVIHRWSTPGSHHIEIFTPPDQFTVTVSGGTPPPPSGVMSKAAQVDCMSNIGKAWASLGNALTQQPPAWEQARADLAIVRTRARALPAFVPRAGDDPKEFRTLAAQFDAALDRCQTALEQRSPQAAKEVERTDGEACTRCHLKFQWGIVKDLSRFPDLRIHPEKQ
jgi:cytochrome c556